MLRLGRESLQVEYKLNLVLYWNMISNVVIAAIMKTHTELKRNTQNKKWRPNERGDQLPGEALRGFNYSCCCCNDVCVCFVILAIFIIQSTGKYWRREKKNFGKIRETSSHFPIIFCERNTSEPVEVTKKERKESCSVFNGGGSGGAAHTHT